MAKAKRTPSDAAGRASRSKGATRYTTLSEKVWLAIQAGKIPNRHADRTVSVQGVGATCPICDLPVRGDGVVEIQLAPDGDAGLDKHHLHIQCYAAWEFERERDSH